MKSEGQFKECDVVIVNYNAGRLLTDCVVSVFAEDVSRAIVVDNDSQDDSLDLLQRSVADERLTIVRHVKNRGFAAACNTGIKESAASHVLFLNPDSVLSPGALMKMLDVLDADSGAGMVGGLLCNPDGSEQPGGRRTFPTPQRAFMRAFGFSRLAGVFPRLFSDFSLHKEPLPTKPVAVEAISGACMLVKRRALDDVGLWDEGYFLHCEDLDWCMRFKLKGWQVLFVPDAQVLHVGGGCSRNRPFFVEWHKHRGMLRFYQKFFRRQYSGILWYLVVAGVAFRFLLISAVRALSLAFPGSEKTHA